MEGGYRGVDVKAMRIGESVQEKEQKMLSQDIRFRRKTDLCFGFVEKHESMRFLNVFVDIRQHPAKLKTDGGGGKRETFLASFRSRPDVILASTLSSL